MSNTLRGGIFQDLFESVERIRKEDPAAPSRLEILLGYPSIHAVFWHRIAHALYRGRIPLVPRLISQTVRFFTQIEIHPGAQIGRRLFIDHGAGVVIGQTAEVGDDVLLYHQVTLGGTSTRREKRHPSLGDRVVVGVGAAVLGAIHIGNEARIGAGAVVFRDVPQRATVVGVPGRIVFIEGVPLASLEDDDPLQDPEAQAIKSLNERVTRLERQLMTRSADAIDSRIRHGPTVVEDFLHGAGI